MQKDTQAHAAETLAQTVIPRREFIAIVAGLMALNALAIDILLPAFPNITDAYDIQDNQI